MAPQKRKRSRKARTEVSPSPSSSSSSSSDESSSPDVRPAEREIQSKPTKADGKKAKKSKHSDPRDAPTTTTSPLRGSEDDDVEDDDDDNHDHDHSPDTQQPNSSSSAVGAPSQAFEDFYLRQMTREFADDLEKLRAAKDFRGEASVGLLVRALRQGVSCFSSVERERIGASAAAAASR